MLSFSDSLFFQRRYHQWLLQTELHFKQIWRVCSLKSMVSYNFCPFLSLCLSQSTLNISNPNFFSMLVQSVSCQVLYMKTVIGTQQLDNATTILPLSERQVHKQTLTCRFYVFQNVFLVNIFLHNEHHEQSLRSALVQSSGCKQKQHVKAILEVWLLHDVFEVLSAQTEQTLLSPAHGLS